MNLPHAVLLSFLLLTATAMSLGAADIALPATAEERSQLSGRELTILRRQMRSREDEAEAAYRNAETAFLVGEYDKAIEEYLAVSREYEDTSYRMRAVSRIGDVYYRQKNYERAVSYYQRALRIPSEPWWPEDVRESYARADYMIGVCYFDQGALNQAFAHFRRFVRSYPESQFLDRAYDFIGRGNMQLERYGQAIEAFRMVGTAQLQRQARNTISPGEDLYVRVTDADIGLASRGAAVQVRLTTTGGDEEILHLTPLGLGSPVFLGTIRTRLGPPRLTKALEEIFSPATQDALDRMFEDAALMESEQQRLSDELAQLPAPRQTARPGETGDRDQEPTPEQLRLREQRRELTVEIENLRTTREQLLGQAYGKLDNAYRRIEAILREWDIPELMLDDEAPDGDDAPAAAPAHDAPDELSDLYTPQQIAQVRRDIEAYPTSDSNYRFRRSVLEYWHRQLLHEYKTLDVKGDATIKVEYLDEYGEDEDNVIREDTVTIASDATILCVGPDFTHPISAVILGDNVRVRIIDPDMSGTSGRDTISVTVSAIPREPPSEPDLTDAEETETDAAADEPGQSVNLFADGAGDEEECPPLVPEGAPSFTWTLTETEPHSGVFTGEFPTVADGDHPVSALALSPEQIVRVAYADERNASYGDKWVVVATVSIVAGTEGRHEVIEMQESKLDRRSELEKGIAMGKLANVYQDLGLVREAQRTFDEALRVVQNVVRLEHDSPLGEEATFQLWNLYFDSGNQEAAAEACARLIAAFPDSPLADDALLIMGKTAAATDPRTAIGHFNRLVTRYADSPLAPEAQFLLAELRSRDGEVDVAAYEACANKFPQSNFAAESLLRLADYYMNERDYERAIDYLERVMLDFPDFDKLDEATFKRAVCVYRMGDIQLAYTLMHEVISKYPGTASAETAARIVQTLARRLDR